MEILSKRECEVIEKSIEGNIVKEIADKLCIAFSTADTHIRNAKKKTGAKNMSQLVAMYMKANKSLFLSIFFIGLQGFIMFSNPDADLKKTKTAKVRTSKTARKKIS
jgi:DNA-binding CsgD family transcriptional regulator